MKPKFIYVEGVRTRYFEAGRGDAVVLIHGGQFGSYYNSYCWSLNFEGLSRGFHVYAVDRLGMGFTDNPKKHKDYTQAAVVKHCYGFLAALGIRKASLVGHSRGALVATMLALQHPEMVKSLVIVDSNTLAPDDPSTDPKTFYADIEKKAPAIETRESVQREVIANSYSTNHITEDFIDDLYEMALLPKTTEAKEKMETFGLSVFMPELNKKRQETLEAIKAGQLKTPTLIIWGLNDPSAPLKVGLKLFEIISVVPKSQLVVFNQAGHYSFRERYPEFDRTVKSFIELV